MTITLHWWMVPIALMLLGAVVGHVDSKRGGYTAGLLGGLVFVACLASAIAFTVGHYT